MPFIRLTMFQLTDGTCASACALFVEFMSHQAGVKTIVVGGLPIEGPMQAVSGSRAAAKYSAGDLDDDFLGVNDTVKNPEAYSQLPNRTDTGMFITYAGFSLRSQVRHNDATALQFKYQAADCRIYWSFANWYNYTQLWTDTYNGIYADTSICVPGSVKSLEIPVMLLGFSGSGILAATVASSAVGCCLGGSAESGCVLAIRIETAG